MKKTRYYTAPDGTKYRVFEAVTPYAFKVYRADRGRATIGDPHNCILALGIRRNAAVVDA
jgi:hypothetical protein